MKDWFRDVYKIQARYNTAERQMKMAMYLYESAALVTPVFHISDISGQTLTNMY